MVHALSRRAGRRRAWLPLSALLLAVGLAAPAAAQERELDQAPPPSSTREIESPIQRVFSPDRERSPMIPFARKWLKRLPPFFADSVLEARFRTTYFHQDRSFGELSEAAAMGGSVYYRSGWFADTFRVEAEGFTSQPLYAPNSRDGTFLLKPGQEGYGVVGIANGRLRYQGWQLTGGRLYLDLPYVNRQDNRMTPNTFESVLLEYPGEEFRVSAGYSWNIKLRNDDEFQSFAEVIGIDKERGLAHAGGVWEPNEDFRIGALANVVPDIYAGVYAEGGFDLDIVNEWEVRFNAQFTYLSPIGDELSTLFFEDDTWNVGLRASTSYAGAVLRVGGAITGDGDDLLSLYGSNPSLVNLMQRSFTRADEKAVLVSLSYDFGKLGLTGLRGIVNYVSAFDAINPTGRVDSTTVDVTFDYRIESGWFESLWLRIRGSWLREQNQPQDGTELRILFRYEFPVI